MEKPKNDFAFDKFEFETPPPIPNRRRRRRILTLLTLIAVCIGVFAAYVANPLNPDAYRWRGYIYKALGYDDLASENYAQVLQFGFVVNDISIHTSEGQREFEAGLYEDAINEFNFVLWLYPENASVYMARGNAYQKLDQRDHLIADYSEALRLEPEWLYNIGNAYYKFGEYQKSVEVFDQAIQQYPSDAFLYIQRGNSYHKLDEIDHVIEDYTTALRLNPYDAGVYNGLAALYIKEERASDAIDLTTQGILSNPQAADLYITRARAYHVLGKFDLSEADYARAIALNPGDATVYNSRAYAYFKQGNIDQAFEDVSKAIQLDPTEPNYYDSRCEFYLRTREWSLALADCQKAESFGWTFSIKMQKLIQHAEQMTANINQP